MCVAVRRYEGVTDPSEAGRITREVFVPSISEIPGFVAHYTLDAGDGVMVSISVFEHKEAGEESTFRAGGFVAKQALLPSSSSPRSTSRRLTRVARPMRQLAMRLPPTNR